MKSLQDKLRTVLNALLAVRNGQGEEVPVYHYRRTNSTKTGYIVWAEDSEADDFYGDNRKAEQQIHGTIDYFTLIEFDETIDSVQEALTFRCIGFRLESVQYEDETNLIHYEWEFWV